MTCMFPFRKKSLVQLNVVENDLIILCYCFKHLNKTLQRRADVVDFFLFCSPTYEILIKVPALVSLCAGQPVSSKSLVEKKNKKRSSLSDGSGRDQDYSPGRKRRSLISTTMTVCAQSLITASLPACNCWATTLNLNSPLSRFGPSFLYCQGDKRGSIQSVRNVCSSREGEKQLVLDSLQTKQGIVRELEMMRGENSAFIIKQDQLQQQRKV